MTRAAISLAVLALGFALACGKPSTSEAADAPSALMLLRGPVAGNLFEQIAAAPEHTLFAGTRRWLIRAEQDGAIQESEYVERVAADGRGGFALAPVDVVRPAMRDSQLQLFELMQKGREAFLYRYRDVRIRDVDLMHQHYTARATGAVVSVAGRACDVIEIDKTREPRTHYVLAIDQVTRLVLRSEEFARAGVLVARMEFESFDPQPDLSGVAMHANLPSTPIDANAANMAELGFHLRRPTLVHGFQLARAEKLDDGTRTWARILYHDGVEPLFYLQGGPLHAHGANPTPVPTSPIGGMPVVRVFRSGSWTLASCERDGYQFLVAGKISEDDLLATLKSALE